MKKSNFLSKENIVNHFRYRWYLYLIALIAAIVIPTVVFSVTNYESPEDMRIDFLFADSGTVESLVKPLFNELIEKSGAENVETVSYEFVAQDSSGTLEQILALRMISKDKDIVISSEAAFQSYASQGVYIPLEDKISPEFAAYLAENNIHAGHSRITDTDGGAIGEDHLYGIPLSALPGITNAPPFFGDVYLSVFWDSGNEQNVIAVMNQIIDYGMNYSPAEEPSAE